MTAWKPVPVEPTKEMIAAAWRTITAGRLPGDARERWFSGPGVQDMWKAMLAAAPTPTVSGDVVEQVARVLCVHMGDPADEPLGDGRVAWMGYRRHALAIVREFIAPLEAERDRWREEDVHNEAIIRRLQAENARLRELVSRLRRGVEHGWPTEIAWENAVREARAAVGGEG